MYVRAGRRPPGESAAELTHPFPFARYISVPMPYVTTHTYVCNLLVLSNLPLLPSAAKPEKKKKNVNLVSLTMYLPCHPARKYGGVIHFGLLMVSCDYHVTKIFAAKKMIIAQLLITITQSYCNYSYMLAAPAL